MRRMPQRSTSGSLVAAAGRSLRWGPLASYGCVARKGLYIPGRIPARWAVRQNCAHRYID
jgi:hypothetical protein